MTPTEHGDGAEDHGSLPPIALHEAERPSKGPVRLLCDEIGFAFDPRLEQPAVLIAFVRELLSEIEDRREMAVHVVRMGGKAPSEASARVLESARLMVAADTPALAILIAENVHDLANEFNPDDAYPTDHLIDMVSSCASAIRFGLESPCHSRHAAAAAQHVWKQVYGVSRFDSHTPAWEKEWARSKLLSAVVSLIPPTPPQQASMGGSEPKIPRTHKGEG